MRSLSFRLTFWYAVATTFTAALFMWVGRFALEDSYVAGIDDLNDKEWEEIEPRMRGLGPGHSSEIADAVVEHAEIDASLFLFQISRPDGSILYRSSNMGTYTMPVEVHGQRRTTVSAHELGRLRVGEYRVDGYDVHIATSLQGWQTLHGGFLRFAGVMLVLVFGTSLGLGYGLSRVALNPVSQIRKTATRIGAENLKERIEDPGTQDEIAELSLLLNEMFDRIESAVLQAQRFAADASHELKTPLSLARLRVEELLKKEEGMSESSRSEMEGLLSDISQLGKVIDDMLLVSKAEAGVLKMDLQERSVQPLVEDFVEDATVLCEDEGLTFQLKTGSYPKVRYDPVWLRHVLFNLLSNALKFCRRDGTIGLWVKEEAGDWVLRLYDEGPGVADSKLEKIFDRFYSEDRQGANQRGSGLGLALCKSIVDLHGGRIAARNRSEGTGLEVEIRIPVR